MPNIDDERDALHDYIKSAGGWLVSATGERNLRIEISERSSLKDVLTECGYRLLHVGTGTRLTSASNGASPWMAVDVFAITLRSSRK